VQKALTGLLGLRPLWKEHLDEIGAVIRSAKVKEGLTVLERVKRPFIWHWQKELSKYEYLYFVWKVKLFYLIIKIK